MVRRMVTIESFPQVDTTAAESAYADGWSAVAYIGTPRTDSFVTVGTRTFRA